MSEVSKLSRLVVALIERGIEPKAAVAFTESAAVRTALAAKDADVSAIAEALVANAPLPTKAEEHTAEAGTEAFFDQLRKDAEARSAKAKPANSGTSAAIERLGMTR